MRNLQEVSKFVLVAAGSGRELASDKRRVVRLELNTACPCQLRLQTGGGDIRFLANVEGRETITFIADGPVTVWPDSEDEVWWWSPEMEMTHVVIPDAETFTKIANRRQRNPDLERMMAKMHENAERRHAALLHEMQSVVGDLRERNEVLQEAVKKRGKRKATNPEAPIGDGGEPPVDPQPPAESDDGGGGDAE